MRFRCHKSQGIFGLVYFVRYIVFFTLLYIIKERLIFRLWQEYKFSEFQECL